MKTTKVKIVVLRSSHTTAHRMEDAIIFPEFCMDGTKVHNFGDEIDLIIKKYATAPRQSKI